MSKGSISKKEIPTSEKGIRKKEKEEEEEIRAMLPTILNHNFTCFVRVWNLASQTREDHSE
jgi:hypothetical protein